MYNNTSDQRNGLIRTTAPAVKVIEKFYEFLLFINLTSLQNIFFYHLGDNIQ